MSTQAYAGTDQIWDHSREGNTAGSPAVMPPGKSGQPGAAGSTGMEAWQGQGEAPAGGGVMSVSYNVAAMPGADSIPPSSDCGHCAHRDESQRAVPPEDPCATRATGADGRSLDLSAVCCSYGVRVGTAQDQGQDGPPERCAALHPGLCTRHGGGDANAFVAGRGTPAGALTRRRRCAQAPKTPSRGRAAASRRSRRCARSSRAAATTCLALRGLCPPCWPAA